MLVDGTENYKEDPKRKRENDESQSNDTNAPTPSTESDSKSTDVGIANLSQAELVRRAFAAPVDLEAEEEFRKEKVSN